MCGRFYSDEEIAERVLQMAGGTSIEMDIPKSGDIYPSQHALILSGHEPNLYAETMHWGFPRFDGKGLLINARCETAAEKKTFRDSFLYRRCIVPARHFYEWDKDKNKVGFQYADGRPLFMAGFYNQFEEERRFVIITTDANESMRPVHHRMPLILGEEQLRSFIYDQNAALEMLAQPSPMLQRFQEEEQQTISINSIS